MRICVKRFTCLSSHSGAQQSATAACAAALPLLRRRHHQTRWCQTPPCCSWACLQYKRRHALRMVHFRLCMQAVQLLLGSSDCWPDKLQAHPLMPAYMVPSAAVGPAHADAVRIGINEAWSMLSGNTAHWRTIPRNACNAARCTCAAARHSPGRGPCAAVRFVAAGGSSSWPAMSSRKLRCACGSTQEGRK